MARKVRNRIYWRGNRAYADFRDFAEYGGKQEALGTDDPEIAEIRVNKRLEELQRKRLGRELGQPDPVSLKDFTKHHIKEKRRGGRVIETWVVESEMRLRTAMDFLGAERHLHEVGVRDVQNYANWLTTRPNGRGLRCPTCSRKASLEGDRVDLTCRRCGTKWRAGTFTPGTVRHYLSVLSNLYRRAQSEGLVPPGYNPVAAMLEKPVGQPAEAAWLEPHDAALLLEAARTWKPDPDAGAVPFMHALIATYLLTGGRKSEILGLEVEDVSFDRKIVFIRPNRWRRLKTRTSNRTVPLWPQLEEILREHMYGGETPLVSGLLFPSPKSGGMIDDFRKALDAIGGRVGWAHGAIRSKAFRHTYTAARLQSLDGGAPVSPWTVARELGHSSMNMVNRVYGHLGTVRHRSESVEYRVEQHREVLGERLVALEAVAAG